MQKYNKSTFLTTCDFKKNSSLGERRAARGVSTRPDEHIHQLCL